MPSDNSISLDQIPFGLATEDFVTAVAQGLKWKDPSRVATTANITLSGEQTIDGILTSSDRVLVKDQTAGAENGIYVSASGAWARADDFDEDVEITGAACWILEGTTNVDEAFVCTTDETITVGTTSLTFVQFSGLGSITTGINLTKIGNTINFDPTGGVDFLTNNLINTIIVSPTITDGLSADTVTTSESFVFFDGSTQSQAFIPNDFFWDISTASFLQSFGVTTQETIPAGIFFRPNGLQMYVIGPGSASVHEYNVSTAWDVSAAVFSQSFSVFTQEATPQGFFFRSDGLKMYVAGNGGNEINEYDLGTAWDISTAVFLQLFSVSTQNSNTSGIFFKPDGLTMYVLGNSGLPDEINEYTLTTAWDILTASFTQVATFSGNPTAFFIRPDGKRLYTTQSELSGPINEYILTTGWDTTTAVLNQTFDPTTQDTSMNAIFFKPDGSKMYLGGNINDSIFEYNLSLNIDGNLSVGGNIISPTLTDTTVNNITATETYLFSDGSTQSQAAISSGFHWNIETASFFQSFDPATQESIPKDVFFKPDGLKMYVVGFDTFTVHEYNLNTAWSVSTAAISQSFSLIATETGPTSIFFRSDGLKMYILGNEGSDVNEYDLGTAWDVSTLVFNQVSVSLLTENDNPIGLWFKPDGKQMYVTGQIGDAEVNEYDLTTAWDISTISFSQVFVLAIGGSNNHGVTFNPEGTRMYISDGFTDSLDEYALTTPWDISTSVLEQSFDISSEDLTINGNFVKSDSTKMYIVGGVNTLIFEYDLGLSIEGDVNVNGNLSTSVGLVSANPSNFVEINTQADYDDLFTAGSLTVTGNLYLDFKITVTGTNVFNVDGGSLILEGESRPNVGISYSGTGTLITCQNGGSILAEFDCDLTSTSTGTLLNVSGGGDCIIEKLFLTGWTSLGTVDGSTISFNGIGVTNCVEGWNIIDPLGIFVRDIAQFGTAMTGNAFTYTNKLTNTLATFDSMLFTNLTGAIFDISTVLADSTPIYIDITQQLSGNLFKQTIVTDATFTAVTDGSLTAGTITAQSANSDGQTTHSSVTTYFEGELVTITGTTNYNGTFQIFNVVAGVSFDTVSTFVSNETTGTTNSDRLTITLVAGHGIVADDDLKIKDTNFYNGFVPALNVVTNTLTVNGTFVETENGSIEINLSLDQTDPRVNGNQNFGISDSRTIAFGFTNANIIATNVTDGTYAAVDVSGFVITQNAIERFKLISATNGIFELIALESFKGILSGSLSAIKSGATENYRFAMSTNGVIPTFATANYVPMEVKTTKVNVALEFSVALNPGDTIQVMIAGEGTINGLTITDMVMGIQ